MKVIRLDTAYWPEGWFGHWCPGCQSGHEIAVTQPLANGAKWTFDGNMERPTFSPSINIRWGKYAGGNEDHGGVCHYFIRGGMIEFCGDSTHALAGKTVALPDIPAGTYVTSQHLAQKSDESNGGSSGRRDGR
jgi:hypothetical protein